VTGSVPPAGASESPRAIAGIRALRNLENFSRCSPSPNVDVLVLSSRRHAQVNVSPGFCWLSQCSGLRGFAIVPGTIRRRQAGALFRGSIRIHGSDGQGRWIVRG